MYHLFSFQQKELSWFIIFPVATNYMGLKWAVLQTETYAIYHTEILLDS